MLPGLDEPLHFKPCTLVYASKCDDCSENIEPLAERWLAMWADQVTKANGLKIKEIKCHVRCGECQSAADVKDPKKLQAYMQSIWQKRKEDEKVSCALPGQSESSKARVYMPGTPASKD